MIRRRSLLGFAAAVGMGLLSAGTVIAHAIDRTLKITPLKKSRSEWRGLLPKARYEILFKEDTAPAR